jgi:uncharacterized protein DUF4406
VTAPTHVNNDDIEGPIYIAGPITGIPEYNAPAFREAKAFLSSRFPGIEILIPIDNHEGVTIEEQSYGYFFRRGLEQMLKCQTVMFLEGWAGSQGAKAEFVVAERCEMPRYLLMKVADDTYMWAGTDASLMP